MAGKWIDKKKRLKRLVYNGQLIVNKYREVKNTLSIFYNKEITKEKSEKGKK